MTQIEATGNEKTVPVRMSARVRLVVCAAVLVAAVVGGGVWLSSHVDLASPALSTVEQGAPEEPSDPATDAVEISVEPAGDEEAEAPEQPAAEEAAQDVPVDETVAAQEGYSAAELPKAPEPEAAQTPTQTQPSQSQSQPQQTTPSTPSTPSTTPSTKPSTPTTPTTPTTPQTDPTPTTEPEPAQPQSLSVTMTVDGSAANSASWTKNLTLEAGATVYDALIAADNNVNARSTGYGIYVVGIDGLAEKDHGPQSGWMYAVNGVKPNSACSNYVLKSGDTITWTYVNVDY